MAAECRLIAYSLYDPLNISAVRGTGVMIRLARGSAEAYFSSDESRLIFQSTRGTFQCDQEFILDLATGEIRLVSTGKGRTTCGYFLPGDGHILYSSTHPVSSGCPSRPDYSKGYVWPVSPMYDTIIARADGRDPRQLTDTPGYDAEAIVYRGWHPADSASITDYRGLLAEWKD